MANTDKELEEQLMEAGNKLVSPPSSVDELFSLLDKIDGYLARVEQSPSVSMKSALAPSLNALITDQLFRHSDVDINVAVASCISEITRITAPDAPYDDDQMKEVFQLIVSSFENLDDKTSKSYAKRTSILETVAKVRSCVVMLDLECDALIVEMFQKFLKFVRDFHPENVVSSMETIMTLVLEESEEIPVELLSPLLSSVKKKNKEVLPTARKLGEKVLGSCAEKIKPYLVDALKSLQTSPDDYWDVVGSICQDVCVDDIDVAAKNKVETSKPDGPLVDEATEATPEVPDSNVSNGVEDTGEATALADSDTLKGKELNAIEHAKSTNADENVEVDVSAVEKESKPDHITKKRGRKPASKSESKVTVDEKEDVKLPDEKYQSKDALRSPDARRSVSGDAAVASENKKKNDNQPSSRKAADDESLTASPSASEDEILSKSVNRSKKKASSVKELAQSTNDVLRRVTEGTSDSKAKPTKRAGKKAADDESLTASPSVSGSLVDESRSKKVARPKKKEGSVKELAQSADDVLLKETEGTSDSKTKPIKRAVKNAPVGTSSNDKSVKTINKSKKEGGAVSEIDTKPLKHLSKVNDGSKSAEGASLKQSEQKIKRRGKAVSEKKLATSAMEDDDNENISSLKSAAKLAKDDLPVEETPKTSSKRKRAAGKVLESEDTAYGEEIVGKRVRVWWPDDQEFYKGTVQSYDPTEKKHEVHYDDNETENLYMKEEKFEFIDRESDMEDEDEEAAKLSNPDASEMPAKKKAKSDQSAKKEKMDISPKRGSGGASSTKFRSKFGRKPGRKPKAIEDDSKNSKKAEDDSSAKTKKPTTLLKSSLKTPGKSKTDDATTPKATKSKDDGGSTPKSLKSKQETGKTAGKSSSKLETPKTTPSTTKGRPPKSGGKPNANGTGKSKLSSTKVKDMDEGGSSTDSDEALETKKEKSASNLSKEQGSEAKSGKKRPRATAA
ncbi:Sister chromatid cohesion protein PDS5 homolog C [Linum perenne]